MIAVAVKLLHLAVEVGQAAKDNRRTGLIHHGGNIREPVGGLLATSRAREGILTWRWWTPAELTDPTAEPVWPPHLGRLLAESGPPDAPGVAPTP